MEDSESGINLQELSNDQDEAEKKEAKEKEEREKQGTFRQLMMKMKYWLVQGHDVQTREMNLKFVRRVSERQRATAGNSFYRSYQRFYM